MMSDNLEMGTFVGGTTSHGSQVSKPGEIVHDTTGESVDDGSDAAARSAEILTATGFETKVTSDIRPYLWGKQIVSIGIEPTAALTGYVNEDWSKSTPRRRFLRNSLRSQSRPRRSGNRGNHIDPVERIKVFCRETLDYVSSALEDVRNFQKTEIEYINSAVARYGEQEGVSAPYNWLVSNLATTKEQQYMG